MKNIFLIALCLFLLSSCKKTEVPQDILPKEKMVSILIDVHVTEAKISQFLILKSDSLRFYYKHLEKSFLEKHNVSNEQYKKSFDFYSAHPSQFLEIYTQVIDSLSLRSSSIILE